jgi:hypothetical protein
MDGAAGCSRRNGRDRCLGGMHPLWLGWWVGALVGQNGEGLVVGLSVGAALGE